MDDLSVQVGKKIVLLRKNKNMSQEELADLAGVTRKTMYNIENGKSDTHLKTIEKILKVLEIEISDFYSDLKSN